MKNLWTDSNVFDVKADKNINSGDVFAIGDLVGVAIISVKSGAQVSAYFNGVFLLPKVEEVIEIGKKVFLSGNKVTITQAATTPYVGICIETSIAGTPMVKVRIA